MLAAGLAAGAAQAGGDSFDAGVLPTPAASILVRRLGLDLAAVVSASHNPWRDNGIKFFDARGRKLEPEAELEIEQRVLELLEGDGEEPAPSGIARTLEASLDDYLRELQSAFRLDLAGLEVVLDCANGATFEAAPAIFERLGAEVDVIGAEPDGRNINQGCGSTAPEALAARVTELGAAIGFAFDGDGDRVVAVDGGGSVRDGDELIALGRPSPQGREGARRRRGRCDGDEQLRVSPGDARGRDRGGDDRRRRPPRRSRARPAGLVARRRAVRAHHLDRLRADRRRHRRRTARPRGARRRAAGRVEAHAEAAAGADATSRSPTARPWRAPSASGAPSSEANGRSRAAAACSCVLRGPSRWCG